MKDATTKTETFPQTHAYANTMSYIMNAPHVQRTDKRLWKPEDFYDAEKCLEFQFKAWILEAFMPSLIKNTESTEQHEYVIYDGSEEIDRLQAECYVMKEGRFIFYKCGEEIANYPEIGLRIKRTKRRV